MDGPFAETQVNTLLNTWTAQIRDATIEAWQLHGDAISITQWENAVDELKEQLEYARNQ